MDLQQYFASQCRASSVLLKTNSPSIKATVHGRRREQTGTVASFGFDGFNLDLYYIERGRAAYAQQTIWLSFTLDCDTTLPYSVYDILSFIEPENFNCYTFTYVDSQELMRDCFGEINGLLARLVPALTELLKDGITKNRLIDSQRKAINRYFGDSVIESGEMLGAAADNIINMMLRNFHEAQIECAVIGGQGLFYEGKDEKALKRLKKSKYRTTYHDNLVAYLENGGTSDCVTPIAKTASAHKGAVRHGQGVAGAFRILGLAMAIDIPVTAFLAGFFYVACAVMFKDSLFYSGFYENVFLMPFFGSLFSVGVAIQLLNRKAEEKKTDKNAIHSPKAPEILKSFYKYLTIAGECLALFGCISSIFSTAVFYKDGFRYSQEDFPLSHQECKYNVVDTIALVEGYVENDKFYEQRHVAVVTEIGTVIDLYNSTFLSGEDIIKSLDLAEEYDIEIKTVKTIEELK
ncbi:MAG: hypothetical protein IKV44_04285 [Clostridia bacterium]|nr:hypothetical protein [Clostridia bacterium]